MKWRRPRFTVRRLMVAVAVAAVAFGSVSWIVRMRELSRHYAIRSEEYMRSLPGAGGTIFMKDGRCMDKYGDENSHNREAWAWRMGAKYRLLSFYPWRAVGPIRGTPHRV